MKNRRSLKSRLFTPAARTGLRYANYAAVLFICVFGVLMATLLWQLEYVLSRTTDPLSAFVVGTMATGKFIIPMTLFAVAAFVLVGEIARTRQFKSEMVALLAQIESIESGDLERKRVMRRYDEMVPVMDALHRLGDRLKAERVPEQASQPTDTIRQLRSTRSA